MKATRVLGLGLLLVLVHAVPARALDPGAMFHENALLLSGEAGGGSQENLGESNSRQTGLDLWYAGLRLGWVPFGPTGPGFVRGALELGLEALYQHYTDPGDAFWAGVNAVGRYHFLSLGRFVPYIEAGAGVGGTDLDIPEIRSDFAFYLLAGAGASVLLNERTALYAGYRLIHLSNGGIESPNTGFEAHTGVVGITFFLK
jgi:hypothetical protein